MNAKEFAASLKSISPTKLELDKSGMNGIHGIVIMRSFNLEIKSIYKKHDDALIELMQNYYMKDIRYNSLTFREATKSENDKKFFADDGNFSYCINNFDGSIKGIEWEENETFYQCAKNSEAFLDILYIYCEVRSKIIKNQLDYKSNKAEYVEKCLFVSGGNEFYDFCKYII